MSQLNKGIQQVSNALADKTIAVMKGIPNEELRKKYLRELLLQIGGNAERNVGMALNSGKSVKAAVAQAYAVHLSKEGVKQAEGMGRWRQDWGGLQGPGLGNQNTPSGGASPPPASSSSSPFGAGSGSYDMSAVTAGVTQITDVVTAVDGLIDAVGTAYGSLTDVIGGGSSTPAPAPAATPRYTIDLTRVQRQMTPLRAVTPTPPAVATTGILDAIPTWALAGGAAVAAGLAYYLIAGRKGKKSKRV